MSYWSRLCSHFAKLKVSAGWKAMSFAGVCTTLLSLLADFVKPEFHLLPYGLAAALLVFIVSESIRLILRPPLGTLQTRWLARTSVSAGIGTIVISIALAADASIGGDRGVLAEASNPIRDLQSEILALDRTAVATLEVARRIETDSKRTATTLDRLDERDRLMAASSLLDRAVATKDLSNRGQIIALETLWAAGHSFAAADLSGIFLQRARLTNASFEGANFMMTDLSHAKFMSSNFAEANFRFATLDNADLSGANVNRARFAFARLDHAVMIDLKGAEANFYAAELRGANLSIADLRGANLSFADLRGANLEGANLTGAVLVGATIEGVKLRDAIISNTDLTGVNINANSLSKTQSAGACRRDLNANGAFTVSAKLIEEIPNQRYRGGVEYSAVMDEIFNMKSLAGAELPLCQSNIGARAPLDFGIRFEVGLLAKANRRKAIVARVKQRFESVSATLLSPRASAP